MRDSRPVDVFGLARRLTVAEKGLSYREHTDVQVSVLKPVSGKADVPGGAGMVRATEGQEFSAVLGRVERSGEPSQQVRAAAEALVAMALIQPTLEAIQSDPFRSELFHGGLGEEMFMSRLHALLAERIVRRADLPIVRAVYQRIMRQEVGPADGAKRMDRYG